MSVVCFVPFVVCSILFNCLWLRLSARPVTISLCAKNLAEQFLIVAEFITDIGIVDMKL